MVTDVIHLSGFSGTGSVYFFNSMDLVQRRNSSVHVTALQCSVNGLWTHLLSLFVPLTEHQYQDLSGPQSPQEEDLESGLLVLAVTEPSIWSLIKIKLLMRTLSFFTQLYKYSTFYHCLSMHVRAAALFSSTLMRYVCLLKTKPNRREALNSCLVIIKVGRAAETRLHVLSWE